MTFFDSSERGKNLWRSWILKEEGGKNTLVETRKKKHKNFSKKKYKKMETSSVRSCELSSGGRWREL